jgi:hypothetical protein
MVVALFNSREWGLPPCREKMKKGFLKLGLGVMLIASLCTGVTAQVTLASAEEKQKKEKVHIVVVEKKDREKASDNGETQKRGPGGTRQDSGISLRLDAVK